VNGTSGYQLHSQVVPEPGNHPAEQQGTMLAQSLGHLSKFNETVASYKNNSTTPTDNNIVNDIPTSNDTSFRAARTADDST